MKEMHYHCKRCDSNTVLREGVLAQPLELEWAEVEFCLNCATPTDYKKVGEFFESLETVPSKAISAIWWWWGFPIAVAIIAAFFLSGCVDGLGDPKLRKFDVYEYIEQSCIGDTDQEWYLTDEFDGLEMRYIVDAIDHINETFEADVQVCGVLTTQPQHGLNVIRVGPDEKIAHGDFSRKTGDIRLWPGRCKSWDHFYKVVLHEFGHALRWDYAHSEDHNDVMAQGWHGVTEYSVTDIAFINERLGDV